MLEIWFKESYLYVFLTAFLEFFQQSCFAKALNKIGFIIVNSKTASVFRYISTRPFRPNNLITYRFFNYINIKSTPFRNRMKTILKDSRIYLVLDNSKSFKIIYFLLIPMVAFYPFIDELGRSVFGEYALFGLWDELYLIVSAIYVFLVWFFTKQGQPLTSTPVGAPMFLLISTSFYLYLHYSTFPALGFEGFRVVVQYILWFYIISSYLTDDKKAYLLTRLLVYSGGIMGIHGIIQYILKVPTPSHWTDIAEGSTGTRVFSIVKSPNVLGSIFILMIPFCLALVLQKKRQFVDRAIFFVLLGAMGLSLILTLSRGAWLGAAVALLVFCLAINPRWLLILGAGGGIALFIPQVMSRIAYLLSPRYIISSMTGGRILRYQKGWELFMRYKWTGLGLGHFGGAVAMNNKDLVSDTFYMDNYWLKTAVEMGVIGIAVFALLIGVLVLWSIRAVKQSKNYDKQLITAGGFAGLCGVLVHNLTENIFEVPYMVVYFWAIAAIVFYFGFRSKKTEAFI